MNINSQYNKYLYYRRLQLDETPGFPSWDFWVRDTRLPLYLGQEHLIFVFKCEVEVEFAQPKKERIGWVELSIDEDANLTVHKVVYQID
jgi:hypothetical protein